MRKVDIEKIESLKENEYLLKVCEDRSLGFMTKLNQDGSVPKAFLNWSPNYRNVSVKETFIFEETFREGWKVVTYRSGKSQDWVKVKHPLGFDVEIYMKNFFSIMGSTTIENKEIIGKFKWNKNQLIKE